MLYLPVCERGGMLGVIPPSLGGEKHAGHTTLRLWEEREACWAYYSLFSHGKREACWTYYSLFSIGKRGMLGILLPVLHGG